MPHNVETGLTPNAGMLSLMQPTNKQELHWLCQTIAKSDQVPKNFQNKWENVYLCVWHGAKLGFDPFASVQNIAVINGKPQLYGDGPLGLVQAHPDYAGIKEDDLLTIEKNGQASCTVLRRNKPPVTMTFTVAMAKKAQLWGKSGPWSLYPERMLMMRARSFALRGQFADVMQGIDIREESGAKDIQTGEVHPLPDPSTVVVAEESGSAEAQAEALKARIAAAQTPEELATVGQQAKTLPREVSSACRAVFAERQRLLGGAPPPSKADRLLAARQGKDLFGEVHDA